MLVFLALVECIETSLDFSNKKQDTLPNALELLLYFQRYKYHKQNFTLYNCLKSQNDYSY